MTTTLLPFTPIERSGYSVDYSYAVLETKLAGGLSRKRRDVIGAPHYVQVQWVMTSLNNYNLFIWYFRHALQDATQPFLTDLVVDCGELTRHRCRTVGGMPKLVKQQGQSYWMTALLEAERNPTFLGVTADAGDLSLTAFPILGLQDLESSIAPTDFVRLINMRFTHPVLGPLDLDGTYDVGSVPTGASIFLDSPAGVNAAWTALAAATPDNGTVTTAIMTVVPT